VWPLRIFGNSNSQKFWEKGKSFALTALFENSKSKNPKRVTTALRVKNHHLKFVLNVEYAKFQDFG